MFVMYDDVTLDLIPAQPHAVASYINGRYANHEEALKRFPNARHLGISVQGDVPADCYDIENGDYEPGDAERLLTTARAAGVWRPCFYADLSNMPAVRVALKGTVRDTVRLWVAAYDGSSLTEAAGLLAAGYDAHQFTKTALGRSLDESLCDSNFFAPVKPAEPKPAPSPQPVIASHDVTLHIEFDSTRELDPWTIQTA